MIPCSLQGWLDDIGVVEELQRDLNTPSSTSMGISEEKPKLMPPYRRT